MAKSAVPIRLRKVRSINRRTMIWVSHSIIISTFKSQLHAIGLFTNSLSFSVSPADWEIMKICMLMSKLQCVNHALWWNIFQNIQYLTRSNCLWTWLPSENHWLSNRWSSNLNFPICKFAARLSGVWFAAGIELLSLQEFDTSKYFWNLLIPGPVWGRTSTDTRNRLENKSARGNIIILQDFAICECVARMQFSVGL